MGLVRSPVPVVARALRRSGQPALAHRLPVRDRPQSRRKAREGRLGQGGKARGGPPPGRGAGPPGAARSRPSIQ
eukprot:12357159-Heterocapsa_arctica.AAC.1